ncbi:GATOR complex protein NPRL3-like isoform X2 [Dendronephthya gigantea]|uniref:GATOR complex protein NPRL3-like isoform X2 n=1 Tax=Dendronephthya gigantea TaxID=151771 RepID=UPI00106CFFE0|nr:GATOR complex protein NPRL3-like isoform X2 [Dendronephthya gigantea]
MPSFEPISVILVTAGSRGEKLLFRYPFCQDKYVEVTACQEEQVIGDESEKSSENKIRSLSFARKACQNYSDKTLANILTPGEKLCGKKFELRIDDVLFVGHPTLVTRPTQTQGNDAQTKAASTNIKMFNIVFALQADVDSSVCECYHELSQRISIALKHEELRCGYFSTERQTMLAIHDEVAELPEASEASPFHMILPKSTLAKALCDAFDSVSQNGTVNLEINNWVRVGFCLPHKVHNINSEMIVKPEDVQVCLAAMRPYHTVLMLVDEVSLSASLPDDCSPDLIRFVKNAKPSKSFQVLSQDTDIPLSLIFSIAAHLVYWGKARIIYRIVENNVYVVSPAASIHLKSQIAKQFAVEYPGMSLHDQLSQFSLPTPLGEQASPFWSHQEKAEQVQRVIWMLKHHLLIQLHMYIYWISGKSSENCLENGTELPLSDCDLPSPRSQMSDSEDQKRFKIMSLF